MVCAEVLHDAPDLADLVRVHPRGRLVEDQDGGLRDERVGEPHTLAVALGERPDEVVRDVGHARLLHGPAHPGEALGASDALELGTEAEVLGDAHLGVERRRLGHVAERASRLERVGRDVVPGDGDLPVREAKEAREDTEGRALSRAVRPQEADDVSPPHLERDVVHRDARAITFHEVRDGDHVATHRRGAKSTEVWREGSRL